MLIENITFLISFVASSGIAVIGILTTYQLFQDEKSDINQSLLYQQIFLFSFFFYSIWGNMAVRVIVKEVTMNSDLISKLSFYLPVLGMPFLMVSWFMLIKFSTLLRNKKLSRSLIYAYYFGFILMIAVVPLLIYGGIFSLPENPDNFLLRLFVTANLAIHLFFLLPLLKYKINSVLQIDVKKWNTILTIYLSGTVLYSVTTYLSGTMGYYITAISIILMFALSAYLPFGIKNSILKEDTLEGLPTDNFDAFCKNYQISRREAEIIKEICTGKSNQAIADKLFITLQTVKDHTHRIYTKTQVKSRVQLANLVRDKIGKRKTPIHS